MRVITRILLTLTLLAAPATAYAQVELSPFAGVTFGGDTDTKGTTAGLSVSWMVLDWIGVEVEAAHTPRFFDQDGFLTERTVTTLTGSVIVSPSMVGSEKWRPYVTAGLASLRPNLREAGDLFTADGSTLALSVGVGVKALLNDHVGIRADGRYVRGIKDSDLDANPFGIDFSTYAFWRTTAGLVLRF